jgi:hypothetical protein
MQTRISHTSLPPTTHEVTEHDSSSEIGEQIKHLNQNTNPATYPVSTRGNDTVNTLAISSSSIQFVSTTQTARSSKARVVTGEAVWTLSESQSKNTSTYPTGQVTQMITSNNFIPSKLPITTIKAAQFATASTTAQSARGDLKSFKAEPPTLASTKVTTGRVIG